MTDIERDILEMFNERVAIMTIDGKQSEAMAIKHAYRVVRERYGREAIPQAVVEMWARVMQQ
ncbi:MAG: hypothetical protein EB060_10395 [Proteobacteria bacterium]|nr:hypothetical protein [Pseudomonadota bacterium]